MGRKKASVKHTRQKHRQKQKANNIPKETRLESIDSRVETLDEFCDGGPMDDLLNGYAEEYREIAKGQKLFLIF